MKLLNHIRSLDDHGTPISLNFNKKGSSHKTYFGGGYTIIVKAILFAYTIHLFISLITFNNVNIS